MKAGIFTTLLQCRMKIKYNIFYRLYFTFETGTYIYIYIHSSFRSSLCLLVENKEHMNVYSHTLSVR